MIFLTGSVICHASKQSVQQRDVGAEITKCMGLWSWGRVVYTSTLSTQSTVLTKVHTVLTKAHTVLIKAHTVLTKAHTVLIKAHTVLTKAHTVLTKAHTVLTKAQPKRTYVFQQSRYHLSSVLKGFVKCLVCTVRYSRQLKKVGNVIICFSQWWLDSWWKFFGLKMFVSLQNLAICILSPHLAVFEKGDAGDDYERNIADSAG